MIEWGVTTYTPTHFTFGLVKPSLKYRCVITSHTKTGYDYLTVTLLSPSEYIVCDIHPATPFIIIVGLEIMSGVHMGFENAINELVLFLLLKGLINLFYTFYL